MKSNSILLTNIQRFSLHDGPGVRTTVFLKGCSLRCPWCSNPENISNRVQKYVKDGVEKFYGCYYTAEQLYSEIIKDKPFYVGKVDNYYAIDSETMNYLPGGVTFSGGECLLQMDALTPVLIQLNSEHIHTAVETCLFVPQNELELAIKWIDLFYVDVKILNNKKCKEYLCGNLSLYFSNLDILLCSKKPIVFRVPIIGGYTDCIENIRNIAYMVKKYADNKKFKLLKVEIIKEHNLGINKYYALQEGGNEIRIPKYQGISNEILNQCQKEFKEIIGTTIPVDICKI